MRSHPRLHFAQVPLEKIEHLIAEKNVVVAARKVTREKGTKIDPYHNHAHSKPTSMWGSFHS
jgi:hypothetical protein